MTSNARNQAGAAELEEPAAATMLRWTGWFPKSPHVEQVFFHSEPDHHGYSDEEVEAITHWIIGGLFVILILAVPINVYTTVKNSKYWEWEKEDDRDIKQD